jgi:hypothetical protein
VVVKCEKGIPTAAGDVPNLSCNSHCEFMDPDGAGLNHLNASLHLLVTL